MANIMLQIEVEQSFSPAVTTIPFLDRRVFALLGEGNQATVREIAVEKIQGLAIDHQSSFVETSSGSALAKLELSAGPIGVRNKVFFAPSHVNSPQFTGHRLAELSVRDLRMTVIDPGLINLRRHIAAHAYIDIVE